ncbi:MAG: caspase family protein [Pleurocapsa minor HA4230-MV1]|nr:caspase family protein [Pleurocapsa minor HA4230-MV1]
MFEINRSLAIIIGINEYNKPIPQLKNAAFDAVQLANVLKNRYGYEVLLLLNRRATKAELDRLVEALKNKTIQFDRQPIHVNQRDRVLFYFAGHGFAEEAQDSEAGKPAGYFMPQDAEGNDKNTWLSMHQLYEALSALDSHHLLMILDCCFAGRISWVGQGRNAVRSRKLYRQSYERFIKHKTEQIITSAAHDEEAQDLSRFGQRGDKNGNSPFAHLLLKVLQGDSNKGKDKFIDAIIEDRVITVHELFTYLQNQLGEVATGQTPGLSQPRKYDRDTGEYVYLKGEYVFLLPQFNPKSLEKLKLDKDSNPYKGLASFEKGDQKLFFGRHTLSQELAKKVIEKPLTIVLGASGSGKSSLVKAGLIPILESASDQQWHILNPMRPGEYPFKELNKILTRPGSGSSIIHQTTEEQSKILLGKISHLINRNSEFKLLLIIDQTEELVTLSRNQEARENFLNLLAKLLREHPQRLHIVLTLRSDFEPQLRDAIEDTYWREAWQKWRFIVTPMNREELQKAIEEPAAQRTLFFESPKLVNDLINEAIDTPGALPLLSFTLSKLYLKYLKAEENHERDDRTITEADYQELGGVARSLTQTADRTYKKLVKKEKIDSSIIRNVMLRMVSLNSGELARRRVLRSELVYPQSINEQVDKLIDRFTEARLLVKGQDLEAQEYVEPVHDVLITGWTQIKYWLEEKDEKESLLLQRRLTSAAEEWNSVKSKEQPSGFQAKAEPVIDCLDCRLCTIENIFNKIFVQIARLWRRDRARQERVRENPVQFLWNANPYINVLSQELNSDDNWLNQVEAEFVQKSVLQKRRNISWRWRIASIVTLGLSVLTIAALWGQRNAQINQISASRQSSEANLRSNQEFDALIESLRAGKSLKQPLLQLFKPNNQIQNQLKETLQKAVYQVKERNRLKGGDRASGVMVSFSPKDSQLLATAGDDGTVRLWNLQGKQLQEWSTNIRPALSFSSDGQQLATAETNGTVRLWDLQGNKLQEWNAKQEWNARDWLAPVSFSPNGQQLATTGSTGIVRLWNLQGNKLQEWNAKQEWKADRGWIWNTSFRPPDGRQLATVGLDGNLRLWNLQSKQLTGRMWKISQGYLRNVSFSPNGQLLAITGDNDIARLLNLQENKFYELKRDHRIGNVSFSPDGQRLATVGENGTVGLRNLQGQLLEQWKGSQSPLGSVSFSLDGQLLATAGSSDTVSLWDLQGQPLTELKEDYPIKSVSFSPDGQRLNTIGWDGTVGLRNLQGKQLAKLKSNHKIISVSFSPDGQRFASVGEDGTAHLWDLQVKQLAKFKSNDRKIISVRFIPNGQQLATIEEDGSVRLWNSMTGQSLVKFPRKLATDRSSPDDYITNDSFSPDGQRLATIKDYDYVHLWDWQGQHVAETPIGHRGGISSFGFSPDTKLLATAGNDGFVRVWKLKGQKLEPLSEWQTTQGSILNLQFSLDGQQFATAGYDGTVRLWDLQGQPLATWKVDQGQVLSIAFSPDNRLLATVGSDGKVKLLPIESFDELMKRGCDWARDYLQNNPDVSKSDPHLCDS